GLPSVQPPHRGEDHAQWDERDERTNEGLGEAGFEHGEEQHDAHAQGGENERGDRLAVTFRPLAVPDRGGCGPARGAGGRVAARVVAAAPSRPCGARGRVRRRVVPGLFGDPCGRLRHWAFTSLNTPSSISNVCGSAARPASRAVLTIHLPRSLCTDSTASLWKRRASCTRLRVTSKSLRICSPCGCPAIARRSSPSPSAVRRATVSWLSATLRSIPPLVLIAASSPRFGASRLGSAPTSRSPWIPAPQAASATMSSDASSSAPLEARSIANWARRTSWASRTARELTTRLCNASSRRARRLRIATITPTMTMTNRAISAPLIGPSEGFP